MAYINYKQAFPSVPHGYLIDILKAYKIYPHDEHLPVKEQNCRVWTEKCRKVNLVKGEVDMQLEHEDEALIETITEKDFYKYLGVLQLRGPLQIVMKEYFELFSKFLSSILRTSSNSANKIKAISTYAISLLTYSFGLIKGLIMHHIN